MTRLTLALTAEQCAIVAPQMRGGWVLLGRVLPEPFTGDNAATSGRLTLELGIVRETALPSLRAAIAKANAPKKKPVRRQAAVITSNTNA